ncbi:hypothetical protein ABK040_011430 [Willaertia magna]
MSSSSPLLTAGVLGGSLLGYALLKFLTPKPTVTATPKSNTTDYSKETKQEREENFKKVYDELRDFLLNDLKQSYEVPEENNKYIERMLNYNVPWGKLNRGLAVLDTLLILNNYQVTPKQYHLACVLGWCIEFLQAFFLIADDIMDASITRRGQDCWYRVNDVQLQACNDYLIVESHIYKILKHYFKPSCKKACEKVCAGKQQAEKLYFDLVELFHEVSYQTELGQLHDLRSLPPNVDKNAIDQIPFHTFTIETYSRIVKYKTAFYSFYLPLYCGLLISMNGKVDETLNKQTLEISLAMGEYFQIQDDYLDCFGDPKHIGKIGRDIEDCKCSWMVVKALELANEEQANNLKKWYGKDDEEKVLKVKELYRELNLEKVYKEYEENILKHLEKLISEVKVGINKDIYNSLLSKIANRTK